MLCTSKDYQVVCIDTLAVQNSESETFQMYRTSFLETIVIQNVFISEAQPVFFRA